MNLLWRTGIFVGLAVATLACCVLFSDAETNPEAGVVVWLPEERAGFRSVTEEMGDAEKEWLPTDTTFLKRTYYEPWRTQETVFETLVSATLIVAGSDSRSLHRPQVCLLAQGWTIERREIVNLETRGGPLAVMDYHLIRRMVTADGSPQLDENGEQVVIRAHYVYWWIGPDGSTPSDEKRVWMEVWNSILKGRRERWAYPSVMVWVTGEDRASAQERAYDFVREVAPDFQKSLGAKDKEDAVSLKAIGQ